LGNSYAGEERVEAFKLQRSLIVSYFLYSFGIGLAVDRLHLNCYISSGLRMQSSPLPWVLLEVRGLGLLDINFLAGAIVTRLI
jgi:hypothetical protein